MQKIYSLLCFFIISGQLQANTYVLGSGKWTDMKLGSTVKSEDVVIITGQMTMNSSLVVEGTLQVEKGAGMIGMKDLVIAKSGKFINNGNTVMKNIFNEGVIHNNMIMEAMVNIENKSVIENNSNMVAGNNLQNYGGNATGSNGAYFVNNNVSTTPSSQFGPNVNVFYGEKLSTQAAPAICSPFAIQTNFNENAVELSVSNKSEKQIQFYSIEKSDDGKTYVMLEMVRSSDNNLNYIDTNPSNTIAYYRVKAYEANGNETALPITSVKAPVYNGYALAK